MSNNEYLIYLQKQHESMRYFQMQGNKLILSINRRENDSVKTDYLTILIDHLNLALLDQMNPSLFYQNPLDIYSILTLLELFYKVQLTNQDLNYIHSYVSDFIKIQSPLINNTTNDGNNMNYIRCTCLEMPIVLADNPSFENSPCAIEIRKMLNANLENVTSGKGNCVRLVRTKGDFDYSDEDEIEDMTKIVEKAGFTTISIIVLGVVLACSYLIYFFSK